MRRFRKRGSPPAPDSSGGVPAQAPLQCLREGLGGLCVQVTGDGIALIGEVDLATRELLAQALRTLEQASLARVVIDLSGLTFLDGRGAGLIADTARSLGPARTLVLRGAGQSVRTVLDALKLDAAENLVVESGPAA